MPTKFHFYLHFIKGDDYIKGFSKDQPTVEVTREEMDEIIDNSYSKDEALNVKNFLNNLENGYIVSNAIIGDMILNEK
jgi:hypothetical protein